MKILSLLLILLLCGCTTAEKCEPFPVLNSTTVLEICFTKDGWYLKEVPND